MVKVKSHLKTLIEITESTYRKLLSETDNITDFSSVMIEYLTDTNIDFKIKKLNDNNYVFFNVVINKNTNFVKKFTVHQTKLPKHYIIYVDNFKSNIKREYYIASSDAVFTDMIDIVLTKLSNCNC
jgi:hypothetical protein